MGADPSIDSSTKRSGEILFTVSLFFVVSVYLLNTSLAERRHLQQTQYERHAAHTQMVERLHSFRGKDARLFRDLTTSSLDIAYLNHEYEARYPTLIHARDASDGGRFLVLPHDRFWRLAGAAVEFGERAARSYATNQTPDDRARSLGQHVAETFRNDQEAVRFLRAEIVPQLVVLDTPSQWDRIAWWIAYGDWPHSGSVHNEGPTSVTFGQRIRERPTDFAVRFHAYKLMLFAPDPDRELLELWKRSHVEGATPATASPRFGIPTFGLSVSAEAVVALAAPVVVLLQLMFLIHWERRRATEARDHDIFTFPYYACPDDPFRRPMPTTLGQFIQRLVWLTFLLLPMCLFIFGVLTRYDVHYPSAYFSDYRDMTFYKAELQARAEDTISSTLDWITFGCMAVSVIVLFNITSLPREQRRRIIFGRGVLSGVWFVAIGASAFAVFLTWWAYRGYVAPLANPQDLPFRMHYLAAFAVFWCLCLAVAIQRRARCVGVLAAGALTIFAFHFVPF